MTNILQRIQELQFEDKAEAEGLLKTFIMSVFPLDIQQVELRPQAVSLNSFNGFLTLATGKRLFFKTHTEQDNVIGEYYNAAMLAEAGYPVIQPIHSSTQAGQHLLIYEVIEDPSVFDVAWQIEQGEDTSSLPALTQAQNQADDLLLGYYLATLRDQPAEQAADAPIHQLFYHRLVGGRLARFYGEGRTIDLPGAIYPIGQVRAMRWRINGRDYAETLDEIINRAVALLHPAQAGPSVIGHGDAHNGNVFFQQHTDEGKAPTLLYFDPAFAGRHHPLLDLTKPLFHNVSAMWMYFPQVKQANTPISLTVKGDTFIVEYDYALPGIRQMFLQSKVERVLVPIVATLKKRDQLRPDWRAYLKAALFCCPFLTLNLADNERFPPEISLLGLAMAVEMGSESISSPRSLIDNILDEVI